jgi:hypothetical protein
MNRHLIKFAQTFAITVLAMVVLFIVGVIGHLLDMVSPIAGALFYCAMFAAGWVLLDIIFEK